mmetsp:Transcript_29495/g.84803  ORF Transcript_29495/g.84803 Transcript_29495/m.84803 type:complete len:330 (+) Transcript_29495:671-1660(+)
MRRELGPSVEALLHSLQGVHHLVVRLHVLLHHGRHPAQLQRPNMRVHPPAAKHRQQVGQAQARVRACACSLQAEALLDGLKPRSRARPARNSPCRGRLHGPRVLRGRGARIAEGAALTAAQPCDADLVRVECIGVDVEDVRARLHDVRDHSERVVLRDLILGDVELGQLLPQNVLGDPCERFEARSRDLARGLDVGRRSGDHVARGECPGLGAEELLREERRPVVGGEHHGAAEEALLRPRVVPDGDRLDAPRGPGADVLRLLRRHDGGALRRCQGAQAAVGATDEEDDVGLRQVRHLVHEMVLAVLACDLEAREGERERPELRAVRTQ